MVLRVLRMVSDRLLDIANGKVVLPALMGDHAEEVEGIRMIGLGLQNLPIDGFRFLKAAGLVVLES